MRRPKHWPLADSPLRFFAFLFLLTVVAGTWPGHPAQGTDASDWTNWRGPSQNGVAYATGLIDRFDPKGGEGSNVLWKNDAAAGISTPMVMNGRLYTIVRDAPGTPRDAEKVICLDAATGQPLWENVYNVFLSDVPAERVGWSHVSGDAASARVYALGACCLLQCMDGESGQTVWSRSLSEEYGMLSTYGGRTNTPVLFEDLVIVSGVTTGWDETARPAHRFFAFQKESGELVWVTATRPLPEDTTYSTPIFALLDGQQVMIAGAGDGSVYGIQPRTGKILWHEVFSRRGINTTAVVDPRGAIYLAQGEENPTGTRMGAVAKYSLGSTAAASAKLEQQWRTEGLIVGKSSPLLVEDRLYVVEDSSRLHVLSAATGEPIGKPLKLGTSMRGSLLYADGKIFACAASGVFHTLRASEDGVETLFKVRLPSGHEVGGSPIAAHGRIYLPTTGGLYCLGTGAEALEVLTPSLAAAERKVDADTVVAQLQLIPAEAIAAPGSQLKFQVVALNQSGQRLEKPPADLAFRVSGDVGRVDADGVFHAPVGETHQAAVVTVQSDTIRGQSRLRVIPPLPWTFDFADGEVPITWIGARYRHEARKVDGEPVLVKITTIPKGTRSQTWMGPSDLHDYTITADVKADGQAAKLPDAGLIAQRYTLDLMGESQQLQIRTWAAQLRMARSVPFAWEGDRWYRLKFQASAENGIATLRGKVWPRDESEPTEWLITATDEAPNRQGSPGLFGNATNAEVTIDNVSVFANE